jgi:hypothetical protein
MDRFFLSFASIFSSGIFAVSYLKEWVSIKFFGEEISLKPSEEINYPYFHHSEELYLRVLLIFGMLFLFLGIASVIYTLQKKWGKVFLCFTLSMLTILAAMVNGAIK